MSVWGLGQRERANMANEGEACEARRLWVAYLALGGFWSGDHACVAEEGEAEVCSAGSGAY